MNDLQQPQRVGTCYECGEVFSGESLCGLLMAAQLHEVEQHKGRDCVDWAAPKEGCDE